MNKTLLITLLLLVSKTQSAPLDDFVFTVKTDNPGNNNEQYRISVATFGNSFNYNVDCNNDGIDEATAVNGNYICDYATLGGPGIYTIRIKDNTGTKTGFPHLQTASSGDQQKLLAVEQWGTGLWTSMKQSFSGASNLTINATDTPDLSLVTDMSSMFLNARAQNLDVSSWDTSTVENMDSMFSNCSATSINLSQLDTSSVTNMNFMFNGVVNFHPDVSNWNTSNLQTAVRMFANTGNPNPDMTAWDISNVTDLNHMFSLSQLSTINYDALLSSWSSQLVNNNVIFGVGDSIYCNQSAHDILNNTHSWTISDGGTDNAICNGPPPLYDSNPIVATPIIFPENTINASSDEEIISIDNNNGISGSLLYGSCQITGADRLQFIFNSVSSFQLPMGSPSFDLRIVCRNNSSGIFNANLTCSHNGPSATASYPLSCTILPDEIFIGNFE